MTRANGGYRGPTNTAAGTKSKFGRPSRKTNRTAVVLISGAIFLALVAFAIILAMENTSDREAAIRKQGQAQAQDNAPKPAPQIIGHDRPASSGSTDMFPDVPGVRFDKDGNPIDELPVHRRPR